MKFNKPNNSLHGGQEAIVRTGHETTDCKLGKGPVKAAYCHPAYLTYTQSTYITRNAGLGGWQSRIKIVKRTDNLRYADDASLMAESEEELKNLLMKVKEESEKVKLKLQYFGYLMQRANSLEKTLMLGTIKGRRKKGYSR